MIYMTVDDPAEIARAKKGGHKFLSKSSDFDTMCEALKRICIKNNLPKKIRNAPWMNI